MSGPRIASNPRFEESYRRIFGAEVTLDERADGFFERFYARFMQNPRVAEAFRNTDMRRQVAMLRRSLFLLVGASLFDTVSPELERLAHLHRRLGIDPDLFAEWEEAIVKTAAEMDPQWNETTELAWRLALSPGIALFKHASLGLLADPDTPGPQNGDMPH